jgi:hypothetical protein
MHGEIFESLSLKEVVRGRQLLGMKTEVAVADSLPLLDLIVRNFSRH